jgi:hypothetical protein
MQTTSEEKLRDLGFPDEVIQETVRAEKRGLFDMEPSPELVERTVARCRNLLRRIPLSDETNAAEESLSEPAIKAFAGSVFAVQKAEAELFQALKALPMATNARAEMERLPIDWLATATFARQKRLRPLMMVDNHNVINPAWWDFDSGLRAFRLACRVVNTIAQQNGVPPAAVLMVLRPDIDSYTQDDFAAIGRLVGSATSDIWMIPYDKAGEYRDQDVIVLGQERVLRLRGAFANPGDAFDAFRESDNSAIATQLRENIGQSILKAVELKHFRSGIRRWEDARTLVEDVIRQRSAMQSAASSRLLESS